MERKCVCVEDIRMKFVKLELMSRRFCPASSENNKSRSGTKTAETRSCVLHEQEVYGTHRFCAERKIKNNSVPIRSGSDE